MNNTGIIQALTGLLSSRKAVIVVVAIIAITVLGYFGVVEGDKAVDFVKWVVVSWLGAQAYEDAKIKSAALYQPANEGATSEDPKS
jgi:hypothetical protein